MAGHHLLGVSSLLVLLIAIASASEYKTPSPVYTPSPVSYTPTPSPKYEAPTPSYKDPVYTPSPEYKTPTPTPKYDTYKPSPKYETPKSSYYVHHKLSILYGVQGVIYCKKYYGLTPLVGATAKISCKSSKGHVFSKATPKADKNGYFLLTFTPEELGEHLKPSHCKVYLASSPSKTCHIATANGITGAPLAHPTTLKGFMKSYILKLYSVAPFVYKSKTYI